MPIIRHLTHRTNPPAVRYLSAILHLPNKQDTSCRPRRIYASTSAKQESTSERPRTESRTKRPRREQVPWAEMRLSERVAHALQTLGYTGVIIVGLGVIGTAIYSIGLELVDQTDAWKVYDDALERVMNSEEVQKLVGIPMTGLADEGGRRGKSLSHHIVEDPTSGKTLLMKFYIKGAKSSGTVHVEMVQNKETSRWDYQLLLVDIAQHGGSKRVIVTDNRPIFTMSDPERRGWFGFGSARGIRRV